MVERTLSFSANGNTLYPKSFTFLAAREWPRVVRKGKSELVIIMQIDAH